MVDNGYYVAVDEAFNQIFWGKAPHENGSSIIDTIKSDLPFHERVRTKTISLEFRIYFKEGRLTESGVKRFCEKKSQSEAGAFENYTVIEADFN